MTEKGGGSFGGPRGILNVNGKLKTNKEEGKWKMMKMEQDTDQGRERGREGDEMPIGRLSLGWNVRKLPVWCLLGICLSEIVRQCN